MTENDAKAVILRVDVGDTTVVTLGLGASQAGVPATAGMKFRPGAMAIQRFLGPLGMHETKISKLPAIPAPALHAYPSDRGVYEEST
jgi:hypothetical protein